MKSKLIVLALSSWLCVACAPEPVEPGTWRATLDLPGGELPFAMELSRADDGWTATFVNGAERVDVPEVTIDDERLMLVLPAFNNRIDASRDGAGFAGHLTLVKRGGKKQIIPFAAEPGPEHRFHERSSERRIDVAGRWAVVFLDDEGTQSEAIAEFHQDGHRVQGTFLTPTGDYRFLDGEVHDEMLSLSTFDGSHAFLFRARLGDDDLLHGDFWSGTAWHEAWSARRDPDASLPDADTLTHWVAEDVEFAFPDTNGQVVSFDDPRFAGKVVVLTLAGTWCPNCHDEAAFMAPFYDEQRAQGLEIVGLMFEHYEDFDAAAVQVDAFRDKFDIGYTLLVAGSSDKQRASDTMDALDRVYAFPTTVFIDRSGAVRRVHTGFNGPGTGEHYERLVTSFTTTVRTLLAEK